MRQWVFGPSGGWHGPTPTIWGQAPHRSSWSDFTQVTSTLDQVSTFGPSGIRWAPETILLNKSKSREIGNLLPNIQRQRCTCYALCHILYPVLAAHASIFRMDSNSTTCNRNQRRAKTPFVARCVAHIGLQRDTPGVPRS